MGDALGAPVEFQSWVDIKAQYGDQGLTTLEPPGHFTDDTQMTLFTCEGLIRASVRGRTKGICHRPSVVRHAYLRWLHTQGVPWRQAASDFAGQADEPDGWLVRDQRLHRRQAPGNTCLSALELGGRGTSEEPANHSKGCGGVMRAAPVGLFLRRQPASDIYKLGCDVAAITHGHPDGWHSAGALAVIVSELVRGEEMDQAVATALPLTSDSIRAVLENAMEVAEDGPPTPLVIEERLGAGWVGEEALAIAAACALGGDDFPTGLLAAVNHSGDTDSTGAICGNLLGASHGRSAIPAEWLAALDAADLVETVASDLILEVTNPPSDGDQSVPSWWWERYPGW